MRICLLGDGKHVNTRSWIKYLAEGLGYEVHLVTFGNVDAPSQVVAVHSMGAAAKTFLRYIFYIPRLRAIIDRVSPDILVGYRITSYGFMAACTGFHPLVLAAQGQNIAYNNSRLKALFCRFAIKRADLIHSWGGHMTDTLISFGADPGKVVTLPRGIDTSLFNQGTQAARSFDGSSLSIISTRGLNPDYNLEQILDAVALLKKSVKNVKYLVAGDGPHKKALEERAIRLGIGEHVEFAGKIVRDELPSRLRGSHVYVSTVISDGVSSSLLEAMACGTFPVVTDNVANRLWIESGRNGFLVKYGDSEELARRILDAARDEGLRRKAAEINRRLVREKASIERNMKVFGTLWEDLLRGEGARSVNDD